MLRADDIERSFVRQAANRSVSRQNIDGQILEWSIPDEAKVPQEPAILVRSTTLLTEYRSGDRLFSFFLCVNFQSTQLATGDVLSRSLWLWRCRWCDLFGRRWSFKAEDRPEDASRWPQRSHPLIAVADQAETSLNSISGCYRTVRHNDSWSTRHRPSKPVWQKLLVPVSRRRLRRTDTHTFRLLILANESSSPVLWPSQGLVANDAYSGPRISPVNQVRATSTAYLTIRYEKENEVDYPRDWPCSRGSREISSSIRRLCCFSMWLAAGLLELAPAQAQPNPKQTRNPLGVRRT